MNDTERARLEEAYRTMDWAGGARKRLVAGVLGAVLFGAGLIAYVGHVIYLATEVVASADATVVSVREHTARTSGGGVSITWCPTLRFEVAGETVAGNTVAHESRSCTEDPARYEEGLIVPVEYDPEDPSRVVPATFWDKYTGTVLALPLLALGGFLLWSTWAGYFKFRQRARKYGTR